MLNVWKRTKELEAKIDEYLDFFIDASLNFQEGLSFYLKGDMERFEEKVKEVDAIESKGDKFRREIENVIYSELLIPESRGDVLAIIENADPVLNKMAEVMVEFSVQKPQIPLSLREDTETLLNYTQNCVREMSSAIRMYFKNLQEVREHIKAVMHFEHECDVVGIGIKRKVFQDNNLDLCCKMQISRFIQLIQEVSDKAEDVCDRLAIYVIKRMV